MIPLLVAAASAVAFLVGLPAPLGLVAKTLPAVILAGMVARVPTPLARTVAAGLALSAVGDALLELPDAFLPGLVAFLLAHVAYTVAFVRDAPRPAWGLAVPAYAWGALAYAYLGPGLGDMRVPVVIYMLVINTMMWRAGARYGRPGALVGAAGAVVFATSDTLIALNKFGGVDFVGHGLAVMLTYWTAQAMIAWAATRPA